MQQDFYCQAALIEKNNILKFIEGLAAKETIDSNKNETAKDEDKVWFKVGLLFANGTMEKYYNINEKGELSFKVNYTSPKIAMELGNDGYKKYILATIQNYDIKNTNGNKNIFNSRDNMYKIIAYCKQHKIDVVPYFIERMPTE